MKHLSEEQLIEHYYGQDGPEAVRHLDACADCAGTYEVLRTDLADLKPVHEPTRSEAYGQQVWASIANRLPVYASPGKSWILRPVWLVFGAAAACSLLVAAFYAGRLWEHRQPQLPAILAMAPAPPAPPRVVVVVLSDHLDRSERFLVQLKHASADDNELALPLRDEARSLLAANRKCQQEAMTARDPELSKALDHLNAVLTKLANHPGGLDADAIAKLQQEMDTDGLLFEVRVLRSRIPDRRAATHKQATGGIA